MITTSKINAKQSVCDTQQASALFGRPGQPEAEHLECPQDSWAMAQDVQEVYAPVPLVQGGSKEEACWEHCYRCRSISHKVAQCPRRRKVQCLCGSCSHRTSRCPQRCQQVLRLSLMRPRNPRRTMTRQEHMTSKDAHVISHVTVTGWKMRSGPW